MLALEGCNRARLDGRAAAGHYESWFARANHPTRPLAFWIRYTLLVPKGRREDAVAEVWAIWFDGESGRHVALKETLPLARATFSTHELDVRIGLSSLDQHHLEGRARGGGHTLRWQLTYAGDDAPLLLLDRHWYRRDFPKAKALVAMPNAQFFGSVAIDGVAVPIDGWVGSQNHNWGSRHTDHYAWGQVAGFDSYADSFLEVATARLKIGPLWTPPMTPLVLRHRGQEIALNRLAQTLRTKANVRYFRWTFGGENDRLRIEGRIEAPRAAFVGLRYYNPPGGTKQCLNSKLAACEVRLLPKHGEAEVLSTAHRAAFEILTDDTTSGVAISA